MAVDEFRRGQFVYIKGADPKRQFLIVHISAPHANGDVILTTLEGGREYTVWGRECELVNKAPKSLIAW